MKRSEYQVAEPCKTFDELRHEKYDPMQIFRESRRELAEIKANPQLPSNYMELAELYIVAGLAKAEQGDSRGASMYLLGTDEGRNTPNGKGQARRWDGAVGALEMAGKLGADKKCVEELFLPSVKLGIYADNLDRALSGLPPKGGKH